MKLMHVLRCSLSLVWPVLLLSCSATPESQDSVGETLYSRWHAEESDAEEWTFSQLLSEAQGVIAGPPGQ